MRKILIFDKLDMEKFGYEDVDGFFSTHKQEIMNADTVGVEVGNVIVLAKSRNSSNVYNKEFALCEFGKLAALGQI